MPRISTPTIPATIFGIWDLPARAWFRGSALPGHPISMWEDEDAAEDFRLTLESAPHDTQVCPIAAQVLPPPIAGKIEPSATERDLL